MEKSPDAFRTISEVADWLETQTHVLRFWESRFSQVKPVKRAGGRRYYRPADVALLGGIKKLLHEDGLTIRGVQKILREQGVRHVSALSPRSMDKQASMSAASVGDGPPMRRELPANNAKPEAAGAASPKAGFPDPAARAGSPSLSDRILDALRNGAMADKSELRPIAERLRHLRESMGSDARQSDN